MRVAGAQGVRLLGLFVKAWRPGQVKTRLAARLGPTTAAFLYARMARWLVHRWNNQADTRWLIYTPDNTLSLWQRYAHKGWQLVPQGSGHLGERLERFFGKAQASGASAAVALGSDSPTLPDTYLSQAWQALQHVPVVLGPAEDGGYYLVGLNFSRIQADELESKFAALWHDVPWSTERVLAVTLSRLQQGAIPYALLPMWYDVDEYQDLVRLKADLDGAENLDERGRRLRRCVHRATCTAQVGQPT